MLLTPITLNINTHTCKREKTRNTKVTIDRRNREKYIHGCPFGLDSFRQFPRSFCF